MTIIKLIAGALTVFIGSMALAIPIHVELVQPQGVNPETGAPRIELFNPSKTAELTYFTNGLQFSYKDQAQREQSLKIHFRFAESELNVPADQKTAELISALMQAQQRGSLIMGKMLSHILKRPNRAKLIFHNDGRMGFINWDYESSDVTMMAPELSPLPDTLKNITFETIYQEVQAQSLKRAAAMASPEKVAEKNPIGFIWDNHSSKPGNCLEALAAAAP